MELLICPKKYFDGAPYRVTVSAPEPEIWRRESLNRFLLDKVVKSVEWSENANLLFHFSDDSTLYISAIQ